ncbi:transposase [Mesorhizobium sp.]|uniref:transposase n=1 Tax=Mesorhizobium sp. TaxID=1871066 RepID=UPI0025E366E2|nr:transposase [Mesorhizobium sp.]
MLKRSDGAKRGRPPFDAVMMFKVLVLQALYSLSDDQAEFQIHDFKLWMWAEPWPDGPDCQEDQALPD